MNILLTALFLVVLIFFIIVYKQHKKIKIVHMLEVASLNRTIIDLLLQQAKQCNALKVNDDFSLKLINARGEIDKNMLILQKELIDTIISKGLIDL